MNKIVDLTQQLNVRNANLKDMAKILEDQHAAKLDLVVPGNQLGYRNGNLLVNGHPEMAPLTHFTRQICQKLDIPHGYYMKMAQAGEFGLVDRNVNTWLTKTENKPFLVRGFTGSKQSIARAFLSDRYEFADNIDTLYATLEGMRETG